MKTFKIGYISDEHLDFYIKEKNSQSPKFQKEMERYVKDILKPEGGDILLCSGDISHYNQQTKAYLKIMTKYYNNVIFVHGNHDLYLVSSTQEEKYNKHSFFRLQDLRDFANSEPFIHFLEGDIINIDGLRIGGLANWYNLPTPGLIQQWRENMNDSNLILEGAKPSYIKYGYGSYEKIPSFDTQAFRNKIEDQWNNLENDKCDIILTHICPAIIPNEYLLSYHVDEANNIFYMSDDLEKVKNTGAEIVIYGHNHQIKEWEFEGIEFKTNAVGYPMEYVGNNIKHFDFVLP
jgi:predicted phosphodiesterase